MAWISNAQGVVQWSNQGWRKYTGIPLDNQTTWQSCIHPDDLTALILSDSQSKADVSTHASEFRMLHHDHSFHTVLGHVDPIRNDEDAVIGYQGACFEVISTAQPVDESSDTVDHPIAFDHEAIRDLFDHDADSLAEIAELFENTCEESMAILGTVFQQTDQQTLLSTAHRLKGAVANMNAPQVFDLCQQLETTIQNSDMLLAETLSQAVALQIARLRTAVRKQFMS